MKQANNICNAEINNRIKSVLRPAARMGKRALTIAVDDLTSP